MDKTRLRSEVKYFGKWALAALMVICVDAIAVEDIQSASNSRASKTISYQLSDTPDKSARDASLQAVEAESQPALITEGFRFESRPKALSVAAHHVDDITLFDVSTELISDFDVDGFYHRFSVTIDADTVYDTSYVYAVLYLSYEGGPWNHYATSDDYHINGDSAFDSFTIETELADGFRAGYYDVRVELYDADHGDWLDTMGPYDDGALSAIPLEDSYRDDGYDNSGSLEVGVAVGVGANGWLTLALPGLLILLRGTSKSRLQSLRQ